MTESGEKRLRGPRCSGTTKAGNPCQALAGSDGLCAAHSGRTDMRELGSKGGRSRRAGAEQLPEAARESLRGHLRAKLDHNTVVEAIERALAGGSESARVAAVRFLADLELYRQEDREQESGAEAVHYRERLAQLIAERASRAHQAGQTELAQGFEQAARELWVEAGATTTDAIEGDFDPERCRATLKGLADRGLIRPPLSARERDELAEKDAEIARLKTQLSEFTVVA